MPKYQIIKECGRNYDGKISVASLLISIGVRKEKYSSHCKLGKHGGAGMKIE